MIGSINLNTVKVKEVVGAYYKDYKNVVVFFKEICEKERTGIVVSHTEEIQNSVSVVLDEELEIEDLKEIFTYLFKNKGYVTENVRLNTKTCGSGYGEYIRLDSIDVRFKSKEKVKQKNL